MILKNNKVVKYTYILVILTPKINQYALHARIYYYLWDLNFGGDGQNF